MGDNALVSKSKLQNYLLVEGKDDEHIFKHLRQHYQIPAQFEIKDKRGIDNLLDTLSTELIGSNLGCLGIVVDADTNIASRWQALRDILCGSGYSVIPASPDPRGTIIIEAGRPTVGIWLMPDNQVPGMIGDFIRSLVPAGDTLWPMAEEIVQRVMKYDCRFPQARTMKANVHTWLAWQAEPGAPLGLAITKRYFDANVVQAQRLIDWVRRLFDAERA
jgi:hypothetical protein